MAIPTNTLFIGGFSYKYCTNETQSGVFTIDSILSDTKYLCSNLCKQMGILTPAFHCEERGTTEKRRPDPGEWPSH